MQPGTKSLISPDYGVIYPPKETIHGVQDIRVHGAQATQNAIFLKIREISYVLRARKILPEADILDMPFGLHFFCPKINLEKYTCMWAGTPKGQMCIYKKADRLQVPTRAVARAVATELPKGDDRVRTIPYPLPFSVPSNVPLAGRPKRVLLLEESTRKKGVLELLRAWQAIDDSHRMTGPLAGGPLEGRGWGVVKLF